MQDSSNQLFESAIGGHFRHMKRGTTYLVVACEPIGANAMDEETITVYASIIHVGDLRRFYIGGAITPPEGTVPITAIVQCKTDIFSGQKVYLYVDSNRKFWVRPVVEFLDGRFERIIEEPVTAYPTGNRAGVADLVTTIQKICEDTHTGTTRAHEALSLIHSMIVKFKSVPRTAWGGHIVLSEPLKLGG